MNMILTCLLCCPTSPTTSDSCIVKKAVVVNQLRGKTAIAFCA